MTKLKSTFMAALLLGAAGLVGGCGGLTPAGPLSITSEGDKTELLMEPVDIWDAEGAGEVSVAEVDGLQLSVRKRSSSFFQSAWIRLVLGWSSNRPNDVFVGAIALGPEVEVRALRMNIDGRRVNLESTSDFHFIPGKRGILDSQEMHLGSFIADLDWLRSVVESRDSAVVTLETSRGALVGDLNVVAGDSAGALRSSAKNRFAEFLEAMHRARRNN